MSILFSGDFHANAVSELTSITKETLIGQYSEEIYNGIRYHIILGDGGFLWPGNAAVDTANYRELSSRPFPVLCVIGNHEPVLGRSDLPESDIEIGEKVIVVKERKPFVAYLKRGNVYCIENRRFLVLGGALSIDKEYRRPNISWWENEYWTEAEKDRVFSLLERKNTVDYVLSHTGPSRINETVFASLRVSHLPKFFDEVAVLNERIDTEIKCRQWFCGHWHEDRYYYDDRRERGYQYLYRKTAILKDDEIILSDGHRYVFK
ncbi:MAG: metallophosphoesterase [Treponema sp.]|nr:metallophosphoesterase [Treponema sp.]